MRITSENIAHENYDPFIFIDAFRDSLEYKKEFSKFYENKSVSSDVSELEKQSIFEEDETARKVLISFARHNSDEKFLYSHKFYSREFNEAVEHYFDHLKDFNKFRGKNDLKIFDDLRGQYHNAAADQLVKDMDISHKLGRGLVQIMSVEKGLESYDAVGQDERRRFEAMLR